MAQQERSRQLSGRRRTPGACQALLLVTLGRIGFEGRYDYGALGPVTNLASRLSSKADAGQILISPRVYAAVEDTIDAEPVGEIELKGFGRPVATHEFAGSARPDQHKAPRPVTMGADLRSLLHRRSDRTAACASVAPMSIGARF
jgi:class 3 adenylate cyclase